MGNNDYIEIMRSINEKLKEASRAYYMENREIMDNKEYDELMDKLSELEAKYNYILPDSLTQHVGYQVISELKKVRHAEKALSLDKTKDRQELASWLGNQVGCISWKLDGLTTVLTYNNGKLKSGVTRGTGEVGEDVTHNIIHASGVPKRIAYKGELVLRGEALMSYSNFNRINQSLPPDKQYKNPRNLASGTLRTLDAKESANRGLSFQAFELVSTSDGLPSNSFTECLNWLASLGFSTVEHYQISSSQLISSISYFEGKIATNDFPSDGLVLQMDDIAYGKSLGSTGKFPRSGKAFKWADETAETTIRKIVWQTSKTGLINPVAVFDPVELEGTTVQRATCCNLSYMEDKGICENAVVTVYKANMIIPTIDKVIKNAGMVTIPSKCPVCGGKTTVVKEKSSKMLYCLNPDCAAQILKKLAHYVTRNAMNIEGLSERTLEALTDNGIIKDIRDIYNVELHPEIKELDGFGESSFSKLVDAINKSRKSTLKNYLYAQSIPNIGRTASELISINCSGDWRDFVLKMDSGYQWSAIDGIGEVLEKSLYTWWGKNREKFIELPSNKVIDIEANNNPSVSQSSGIAGKVFCITGSVYKFKNRDEAGTYITQRGGKLASSVSKKTDYLVTNDTTSGSTKNKKAKEFGVPIITEDELISLGGGLG